ncbi:MAG TPA: hypothetical protein VL154_14785 [Acetobacteraceae bacterium]|jgi:hypothetical protein|nr:hypothetical protein [Acetobacteraceae bacterium]
MSEARSSFCEQKEAKKLFIPWSPGGLRVPAAAKGLSFFGSFFPKKELLP